MPVNGLRVPAKHGQVPAKHLCKSYSRLGPPDLMRATGRSPAMGPAFIYVRHILEARGSGLVRFGHVLPVLWPLSASNWPAWGASLRCSIIDLSMTYVSTPPLYPARTRKLTN